MSAKRRPRTPSYRRQRRKNGDLAFVELNGRRHWLGRYGSKESRQKYDALVAEWLANGRRLAPDPEDFTILELAARYWSHAQGYYLRPDETPTQERSKTRYTLALLNDLYGHEQAAAFGPRKVKALRETLISRKLARSYINDHVGRIKHIFKWSVGEELVPPAVWHALQAVEGLKAGRSEARETEPVRPVPDPDVDAVLQRVTSPVRAMIELQGLTAMRPGEVVVMRPVDLDTSGPVWTFTPEEHKTAWRGHARTIYLGPRAQAVVAPFLNRPVGAFMFSPREAELERRQRAAQGVRRPDQADTPTKTGRKLRDHYSVDSYRRAVEYACKAAGVPVWTPGRLRHNRATEVRRQAGLDVARVVCGHRSPVVTEIYAEVDRQAAIRFMAESG